MERATPHPTDRALKSFGLGTLDEAAARAVLSHLSGCPDCREKVTAQSGDSFLDRLRGAHGAANTPAPAASLAPLADASRIVEPVPEAIPGLPGELDLSAPVSVWLPAAERAAHGAESSSVGEHERTRWIHSRGSFTNMADKDWTEAIDQARNFFREIERTDDFIELKNKVANVRVRLYRNSCRVQFNDAPYREFYRGTWE